MPPGRRVRDPIARGEPGYRAALDPNGNGIACEGVAATTSVVHRRPDGRLVQSSDASRGQQVVDAAMAYLGTTYAWGGGDYSGPSQGIRDGGVADRYGDYNKIGFDCSGLALYAWAQVGVYLPHYSGYQYTGQPHVSRSDLQPGDLVFYRLQHVRSEHHPPRGDLDRQQPDHRGAELRVLREDLHDVLERVHRRRPAGRLTESAP